MIPGTYQVELAVAGTDTTKTITVTVQEAEMDGENTGGEAGGTDSGKEDAVTDSGTKELPDTVTVLHNHTEKTVVKNQRAATYTEIGYTGDTVCAVCGKTVKKERP